MGVCTQSGSALQWQGGHELVRIEPWGANSLRVRGTVGPAIRDVRVIVFDEALGAVGSVTVPIQH